MVVKTSINFLTRDSHSKLILDSGTIITSLTGSISFPEPDPTLPVLTAARDAYTTSVQEAAHRDMEKIAIRTAKREDLVTLLRKLANYVNANCNGDPAVLLSSGFPAQQSSRIPVGPLAAPVAPILRQGPNTCTLVARTGKIHGALAYNWRVALASAPTVYVQTAQTTSARVKLSDLAAGQIHNVQVNALGTAGISDWSDVAARMVT